MSCNSSGSHWLMCLSGQLFIVRDEGWVPKQCKSDWRDVWNTIWVQLGLSISLFLCFTLPLLYISLAGSLNNFPLGFPDAPSSSTIACHLQDMHTYSHTNTYKSFLPSPLSHSATSHSACQSQRSLCLNNASLCLIDEVWGYSLNLAQVSTSSGRP